MYHGRIDLAGTLCEGGNKQPATHTGGLWTEQGVGEASGGVGAPPDDLPPEADGQGCLS